MGLIARWKSKRADARKRQAAAQQTIKQAKQATKQAKQDESYAQRVLDRHKPKPAPSPPSKTLAFARSHIGVTEQPAGSNRGQLIDVWQRDVDMLGQSWCGAFVHAALAAGGVKGLSSRMRYCPYIVDDGKAGVNGLVKLVTWADAKPGDLAVYQWDTGAVDHVGIIESMGNGLLTAIEGNTSNSQVGSQSNGGGVFRRTRERAVVAAIVRPRYP